MESDVHSFRHGADASDPHVNIDNIDDLIARARRCRTLDRLAVETDLGEGLAIESLEPGTTLTVQTLNSQYRLTVMDGDRGEVLVEGGRHVPEPTPAVLQGSSAGGNLLKAGWIGVDLHLEFRIGPRRITTSRVRSVKIERAAGRSPSAPSGARR